MLQNERPSYPWHQSWIIRTAVISMLVVATSTLVSAYIAVQGLEGLSRYSHDHDVEKTLASHLALIKEKHKNEIKMFTDAFEAAFPDCNGIVARDLEHWLSEYNNKNLLYIGIAAIDPLGTAESRVEPGKGWISSGEYDCNPYKIKFPKWSAQKDFEAAEQVGQRYLVSGEAFQRNLIPNLISNYIKLLVASFIFLVGAVAIVWALFRRRISEVIAGFSSWSEIETNFRFAGKWTGELHLITAQFNIMADAIEVQRRRRLYLEKVASWQTMARKLAHEIKNPLTPIQMMVSNLTRKYSGNDAEFENLLRNTNTIVSEEIASLRRIVEHFSNFASLPNPSKKKCDLVEVCNHVITLQKQIYANYDLKFEVTVEKALGEFDAGLLRQVLINLIKNAAEACAGKSPEIAVKLRQLGESWIIEVEDNGPGIPTEHLKEIFEAYFTTKNTGPERGMGLGLAICQKIILDHHGEITATSRPGNTLFSIRLPKTEILEAKN